MKLYLQGGKMINGINSYSNYNYTDTFSNKILSLNSAPKSIDIKA